MEQAKEQQHFSRHRILLMPNLLLSVTLLPLSPVCNIVLRTMLAPQPKRIPVQQVIRLTS